jgi:hypothetical protein
MVQKENIAVVHLIWLPYGVELFKQFIDSYMQFNPGCEHSLLLVFNGVKDETATVVYHDFLETLPIAYTSIDIREGQDLECYFTAAAKLTAEYIVILNSFSVILSNNWLLKYRDNFSDQGTGLIGATGSCQSYYSSVFQKNRYGWEKNKGFTYHFRKYKLFIKAFFYWRFLFRPFPDPHIRTNAFMIKRSLFLQLQHKPFVSKFAAYQFESGRKSMTNQLLKMGYKVFVMDLTGKTFEPAEWKESSTFWIHNQENLLVADNQTMLYTKAAPAEKKEMTRLAWGTT